MRSLLLLVILVGQVFGQVTEPDTKYRVTGIEGSERIGDQVLVDKDAMIGKEAIGTYRVITEASIVTIRALNQKFEPVETKEIDEGFFFIFGSGKIRITVTCVDFDKKIFEQKEEVLVIDGNPEPNPDDPDPPPPDPDDVPDDEFNNIGKRIHTWSQGLPANRRFGNIYYSFSQKIVRDVRTINQINADMNAELLRIPEFSEYQDVMTKLSAELNQRWSVQPLTKTALSNYWKAISEGFGHDS